MVVPFGLCLLGGCGSQSLAQAQLASIVAGCKTSLDIVRRQGDPKQVTLVEDGCRASINGWQADVPDGGAK